MTENHYSDLSKSVAVLQSKFNNIEKGVEDIKSTLHDYISKEDQRHREREERYDALLAQKADARDVQEIKKNIAKGVWIVITAVIVALLALIIKV